MMKIKISKFGLSVVAIAVCGLVLFPIQPVNALSNPFNLNSFAYDAVVEFFAYSTFIIFTIAGKLVAVMAKMLQTAINIPVYPDGGVAVIDASWKVLRNFANMFFIVGMIVMAFATIFNVSKYEARSLFPKLLLTAVFINFSLVLGVMVIQGTQILSNTFLTAIGDMSTRLGEGLSPAQFFPDRGSFETAFKSIDQGVSGTLLALIMSSVLLGSMAISIMTALLFTIIRIPILWALLVVSPMAWILNIFPAGQGTFRKWWSTFIAWNMFLPIFLFFLYFGLYFLSSQDQIISAIASQTANQKLLEGYPFTFQLLFFYVMASLFLIGGTATAMKASMFSGTGVVGIAQWSKGTAQRTWGLSHIKSAGDAAKQKLGQIQEEGFQGKLGKLYGGKYGMDQQTGRWASTFGVRGAEIKNQRAFVDRAGKDYSDFERQYQNGKITEQEVVQRAKQFSASDPRGFAYRKLAAKIGQLDNPLFVSTLEQLSNNPLAAEDFAKTAKESKFSKMKGADLARMAAAEKGVDSKTGIAYDYTSLKGNVAARREMYRYVQSDRRAASGLSDSQFETGLKLFGGHTTAEGKAFMKEMAKVSPDHVMNYNLDPSKSGDSATRTEIEEGFDKAYGSLPVNDFQLKTHVLAGSLKTGDLKDMASLRIDVWRMPEFQEALKLYISQLRDRARTQYINRLDKALIDSMGGDLKTEILHGNPTTGTPGILSATFNTAPPRPRTPTDRVTPPL